MANGKTQAQPAVEMKMQPDDLAELRSRVADLGLWNAPLGRVLDTIVLHLAHAHGLDPVAEDARLKAEALAKSREEEDARIKAEAEALAAARAAEDALPDPNDPRTALAATRAAQDAQLKADAEALAKKRAEEDALASGEPAQEVEAPAQVEAPAVGEDAHA